MSVLLCWHFFMVKMNNILKSILGIIVIMLIIAGCENNNNKGPVIDKSELKEIDLKIHRYGKALFSIDTNNFQPELEKIHNEFRLFLGEDIKTPHIIQPLYEFITDTSLISIARATEKEYPSIDFLEYQLADAFARYEYFFPGFIIPDVHTYISNLYYENPVIYNDLVIIIALDIYLGPEYQPYRTLGLPYYIIRRMTSDRIAVDVMMALYETNLNPHVKQKTLVDRMIDGGKQMYYLDAMLPEVADSIKIGYTSSQMNWIENNSKNIWAFLVDNKLFYSADHKVHSNLTKDGPFTSGFSNDSPPKTGIWLGWQIVRSYMHRNPDVSVQELIDEKDSQKIFNGSGYKP